jgi:peptidyl-prolyl cis-trans isomerase SurA
MMHMGHYDNGPRARVLSFRHPATLRTAGPVSTPPALAVFAVAALLLASGARAERQLIDRIVAVVEDEAIFESDVDQAVRQYFFQRGRTSVTPAEREEVFREALENLINDKLVIAQAGRLGIDVPFSDVEAQVARAIEENVKALGGEEAFNRQLEAEGLTLDELKKLYRTQVKNRMLVERVLQRDMARERGEVSEAELRKFYEENLDRLPKRPEVVHLKTIFLGFETSSSATASARRKTEALRARITAGEDFAAVAKAESEDPSAPLGGDLGFLRPKDLREPALAKTAAALEVGAVSEPVLTMYGYHLLQVTEKRAETGEVRLRHILVRSQPSDDDIEEVFASASEIHRDLTAGAPFDSLAARYNTDPSAGKDGDLGWLRLSELPQFFRDVLANMKPGEVSPVFRESTGFRIVKLVERDSERTYEFSEIKDDLKRLYDQERFSANYDAYVAGLRKKFSVEIRI